ncbi:MAG: hypothetical protein ACI4SM_02740 [Candidatus Gastranaerophilaceae bacterium]
MTKFIKKLTKKYQRKASYLIFAIILSGIVYVLNLYGFIPSDLNFENTPKTYSNSHSEHKHSEVAYQEVWCKEHNGITEYKNRDYTRVDCLTKTNAVEFDFAKKWAESVGQALHYQLMTGKRGRVVLILENSNDKSTYFKRVEALAKKYDFDAEYMTPQDLHLNENGKCIIKKCKCHKK